LPRVGIADGARGCAFSMLAACGGRCRRDGADCPAPLVMALIGAEHQGCPPRAHAISGYQQLVACEYRGVLKGC